MKKFRAPKMKKITRKGGKTATLKLIIVLLVFGKLAGE